MKSSTDNKSDLGIYYTENATFEKTSNSSVISDCIINQIKNSILIEEAIIYKERIITVK